MIDIGLNIGISGQLAFERRMETIANNVANSQTAGFRAEKTKFEALLSQAGSEVVAYSSRGATYLSRQAGEMVPTGNLLDVAVQGRGWLAVQTPQGTAYTRDGRMTMLPTGDLQTITGHPVLDAGGAALVLNPRGGTPQIANNGEITQDGRQVGQIGLFEIANEANLRRHDTSSVIPDRPAEPVVDFSSNSIHQGFIERSNVNPVLEMSSLISLSRAFDSVTSALGNEDGMIRSAIEKLGSSGR